MPRSASNSLLKQAFSQVLRLRASLITFSVGQRRKACSAIKSASLGSLSCMGVWLIPPLTSSGKPCSWASSAASFNRRRPRVVNEKRPFRWRRPAPSTTTAWGVMPVIRRGKGGRKLRTTAGRLAPTSTNNVR